MTEEVVPKIVEALHQCANCALGAGIMVAVVLGAILGLLVYKDDDE